MERSARLYSWIFVTLAFAQTFFSMAFSQDISAKSVVLTHPGEGVSITENMPEKLALTYKAFNMNSPTTVILK